jgi:hypothetical protein
MIPSPSLLSSSASWSARDCSRSMLASRPRRLLLAGAAAGAGAAGGGAARNCRAARARASPVGASLARSSSVAQPLSAVCSAGGALHAPAVPSSASHVVSTYL